jgi:hypothetical protein
MSICEDTTSEIILLPFSTTAAAVSSQEVSIPRIFIFVLMNCRYYLGIILNNILAWRCNIPRIQGGVSLLTMISCPLPLSLAT